MPPGAVAIESGPRRRFRGSGAERLAAVVGCPLRLTNRVAAAVIPGKALGPGVPRPPFPLYDADGRSGRRRVSLHPRDDGSDWIGRTLAEGRFILQRLLAYGGSGAIWLAEDTKRDRLVAIKFLRPSAASDEAGRARFVREGRRFASLRHPNLVRVYKLGSDRGQLFLVIQFVEGRTLLEILKEDGPFDVDEGLRIARDIAGGLTVAHEQSVVHRDLKPANVMIRAKDRRVKVLDFGIAKDLASDTRITRIGYFVGTPAYSAPEQIAGLDVDYRADIYALGVILYELLSGKIDFADQHSTTVMRATLREERVPLGDLYDTVARPVARLIHKMTRRQPERRPQTMEEVVSECDRIREVLAVRPRDEDRTGIHHVLRDMLEA